MSWKHCGMIMPHKAKENLMYLLRNEAKLKNRGTGLLSIRGTSVLQELQHETAKTKITYILNLTHIPTCIWLCKNQLLVTSGTKFALIIWP